MRKIETFLDENRITLNDQQKATLEDINTATLLLAVPGSGKTTTMVARLGYMIFEKGIDPSGILVVTYNKMAQIDMEKRYREMFKRVQGNPAFSKLKFRTLHALSYMIYRQYWRSLHEEMRVLETETKSYLRTAYRNITGEFLAEEDLKNLETLITRIKNNHLKGDALDKFCREQKDFEELKRLYKEYDRLLEAEGKHDFDDMLVFACDLLTYDENIRKIMQGTFDYIMVDEAQDTCFIQHEIIQILGEKHHRIFMVGDEDQTIYGFRGAYPEALLNFKITYPEGIILRLEENFRSGQEIVKHADSFIKNNRKRLVKNMKPFHFKSGKVLVERCLRTEQYDRIIKLIEGSPDYETAILYRNNDSVIPLASRLIEKGIPFNSRGLDQGFFTSNGVNYVRNIFRLADNSADCEAFLNCYFNLGLYINRDTAYKAAELVTAGHFDSAFEALLAMDLKESQRNNVNTLRQALWRIEKADARTAVRIIATELECPDKFMEKLNILAMSFKDGESRADGFARLEEVGAVLSEGTGRKAPLTLSTMHSSKGQEYASVIIIDAMDGILPAYDALYGNTTEKLEEERRLFYVAATRAKESLIFYKWADAGQGSRFITEFTAKPKKAGIGSDISGQGLSGHSAGTSAGKAGSSHAGVTTTSYGAYVFTGGKSAFLGGVKNKITSSEKPEVYYAPGERVIHKTFGEGTVVSIDSSNITIHFDNGQERKLGRVICEKKGMLKKM